MFQLQPKPYTSLEVVNTLTVISKKGIHHQERTKCLGSAFPHSDGSGWSCVIATLQPVDYKGLVVVQALVGSHPQDLCLLQYSTEVIQRL